MYFKTLICKVGLWTFLSEHHFCRSTAVLGITAVFIIIIIIRRLNARRSPISHLFLTRWVSQLLGLALVSWTFARIGVHRLSLRLPYLVCSIRSFLPLDFNRVSSLRPTDRHPFGRPFIYSLFRWVSRLGSGSGTRCCGPRGGTAVRIEQKLDPNFCRGRDRTSDHGIQRPRILPLDYRVPLPLDAPYDMQEATAGQILTPNLQG